MNNFTLFYKRNGDFVVCGNNQDGQLGIGDYNDRTIPTVAFNNKNIKIFRVEILTLSLLKLMEIFMDSETTNMVN